MNKRKRDRIFAKYIEPFADDVFRILNNVFDNDEQANDLAQIVLEKSWVNLHTLRKLSFSGVKFKFYHSSASRKNVYMNF